MLPTSATIPQGPAEMITEAQVTPWYILLNNGAASRGLQPVVRSFRQCIAVLLTSVALLRRPADTLIFVRGRVRASDD